MVYIFIIVGSMLLISLANALMMSAPSWSAAGMIALSTLLGTVSVIAWDGIVAFLIRRLPENWFAPERSLFHVGKSERLFYRRVRINDWKCCVPELGCFTGFKKSEFTSPRDSAYLARFLLESNYGVAIHLANALLGFLIILLPWCQSPAVALPIALVNAILSLLPVAVLRFHTAPLLGIYMHAKKKSK